MSKNESAREVDSKREAQVAAFQTALDVVGTISQGFFILDSEWRFAYLNAQAAQQFESDALHLTGRVIWEILPSLKGSVVELECRRSVRDNIPVTCRTELLKRPKEIYEIRILPSPSGIVAYSMPMTELESRSSAQRENDAQGEIKARLQRLIDAAPAYISYLGTDYKYRIVNKAYESFGYAPHAVVGRTIGEILGKKGWSTIKPYVERAFMGECVTFERDTAYPTVDTRWVRGTFTPDIDDEGQVRGVMICVFDITDLKTVKEGLRKTAEELRRTNDAAPVAIWVSHDPSCEHITSNVTGQRILNAASGENVSVGSARTEPHSAQAQLIPEGVFFDEHGRPLVIREMPMQQSVLRDCEIRDQVLTWKEPNGAVHTLLGSAVPLHDEHGQVRGSVGCFVDVTTRVETERALRKSEERLRLAAIASGIGYWSWNIDSEVSEIDQRTAEIFGVSKDAPVSAVLARIMTEDRERVQNEVQASLEGKGPFRCEFRVGGDGSTCRWVFGLGDISLDANGKAVNFMGMSMDISERKRIEDERHRFVSLVENSTEFVGMCDLKGMPFYFNEAGLRMVGLDSLEEALLIPVEQFVFPEDRAFLRNEFHPKVIQEGRGECELQFRHFKTGEARWMIHTVFPVRDRDGHTVGLATLNRDITDRKRAEQLLQDADRRKDEFLATLGHELRNPLAPISNALHILSTVEKQPEQIRRLGDLMNRQVKQLKHLIDDLLDVSRISRGKIALRREKFDLREAIQSAEESARPLIDTRGHELLVTVPDGPVRVDGDRARLTQVFGNLLHNAAKYTDPHGRIELSLECNFDTAVVAIRDTGVGIPPDMLDRVFEPFMQVNQTIERSQGGLGIGLTLVRNLVELHRGMVEARSEGSGKGSEFIVTLPILEATTSMISETASQTRAPGNEEIQLAHHRVMIVDDLTASADTLAMLLESLGQETCVTYSARSALEKAETFNPDVVISDISMPDMDGYRLAEEIRQKPGKTPLLVALTGCGQEADRRRAYEAGFNRHLVKPASITELRGLLGSV